jgi:membrane protein YqaA with SNARE-associated domain
MKRGHVYHVYHRRTGTYRFIGENALRLFAILIAFGAALYLLNKYVLDLNAITDYVTRTFSIPVVLTTFFLSELTLGILSPELYIVWVESFSKPWLWVLVLSMISYVGGLGAYFIGSKLYHLPKIHRWVDEKFAEQFKQIRRYGGVLIVLGALTPLPYPPICIVSGVVKFPFKRFALLTLIRFGRLFMYAAILFKVI